MCSRSGKYADSIKAVLLLDEAIKSRVHLTVSYEGLTRLATIDLMRPNHYPGCVDTLVENGTPSEAKCACPATVYATFGETDLNALETDVIGAEMSETIYDGGNSAAHHEGIGGSMRHDESPGNQPEIPLQPSPEDDQFAFSISRNVMLGRAADIPEIVDFH